MTTGASNAISTRNTAQPIDGAGHVFAQVAWLDDTCGAVYSLESHEVPTVPAPLRPLYVCLGVNPKPAGWWD